MVGEDGPLADHCQNPHVLEFARTAAEAELILHGWARQMCAHHPRKCTWRTTNCGIKQREVAIIDWAFKNRTNPT
jgi:hypothetical protein